MTGPEHYREAERLLSAADDAYMDDSYRPDSREEYASEEDYLEALETAQEMHVAAVRDATLLAAMAQVHATLAVAHANGIHVEGPQTIDGPLMDTGERG